MRNVRLVCAVAWLGTCAAFGACAAAPASRPVAAEKVENTPGIQPPAENPKAKTVDLKKLMPELMADLPRNSTGYYTQETLPTLLAKRTADYADCGALAAATARYGKSPADDYAMVVDMGSALGALCIFSTEKTLDAKPFEDFDGPQGQGAQRRGSTLFWRGRYFVKVRGSNDSFGGGTNAMTIAYGLAELLPNPKTEDDEVKAFRTLPMMARIPGSDRYVAEKVAGFASLPRGFTADYGCGSHPLALFRVAIPKNSSAEALVEKTKKEAVMLGYDVKPYKLGQGSIALKSQMGAASVYVIRAGNTLGVAEIEGEPSECEHVLREFERALKGERLTVQ